MRQTVYTYDSNGYYLGTDTAFNSILPVNSTAIAPIITEGFHPQFESGAWNNVESHVGEIGFVNGEPFAITQHGAYPEGWQERVQGYDGQWYPANAVPEPPTLNEQALQIQLTKREFLKLVIALTKDTPNPITLVQIEAYVASASDEIRLEWDYATFVERKHPLLETVSASFGITSEMLDIMFVNAEQLLFAIDNGLPLHEEA